jgi:hypothetical protein
MDEPTSAEVKRFILTSIPSVPHLETLLLLWRERDSDWDAQAIARRTYVPERTAAAIAAELAQAGIVDARPGDPPRWRFDASREPLAATVAALDAVYVRDLVGVTRLIHSRAGRQAHAFADAFKLRKEPDHG